MAQAIITFTDNDDDEGFNVKVTFEPEIKNNDVFEKSQAQMHAIMALKLFQDYAENKS